MTGSAAFRSKVREPIQHKFYVVLCNPESCDLIGTLRSDVSNSCVTTVLDGVSMKRVISSKLSSTYESSVRSKPLRSTVKGNT